MTRFRTQDTRASTARKLNELFAGNEVAEDFFRFRETPQTYDQWDRELEGLRKALLAALYQVEPIEKFRFSDTRQLRCRKLNLLAIAVETGPVALAAPVNVSAPTIVGEPIVGNELVAVVGSWTGNPTPVFTYQWLLDAVALTGETNAKLTLVEAHVDGVVTVTVTATNTEGTASATSAGVGPVAS